MIKSLNNTKLNINLNINSQKANTNSYYPDQQDKINKQNLIDLDRMSLGNNSQVNISNNPITSNNIISNKISENNFINAQSEMSKIPIPNKDNNINFSTTNINFNNNNIYPPKAVSDNNFNNLQKKSSIIINQNTFSSNSNTNSNSSTNINYSPKNLSDSSNLNNSSTNNNNNSNYPPSLLRKIKQIESLLNQKLVNITELRTIAWKGLPYGKNNLI